MSKLLHRAQLLAEALGERAAGVDAGTHDPAESFDLLRRAGFLRLLIPEPDGGDGASFAECARVLETLARHDLPTALGLNMHNVAIGSLAETTEPDGAAADFRRWAFDEILRNDGMFASATSEAGSGAKLRGIATVFRREPDRYVLSGRKAFVSLAGVADYFVVAAREAGEHPGDEISHFVVRKDDPGLRVEGIWPGTALRGTATATMVLDDVPVPRHRLFLGVEGMSLFKLVREPHWMVAGYTGAYVGLAGALLDEIVEAVARNPRRSGSAVAVAEVGRLAIAVESARALLYRACDRVDAQRGSTEANVAVHAAKYQAATVLADLVATAPAVCGTAAVTGGTRLSRLLREAPYCAVMPAQPHECLEYVGKARLGVNLRDARAFDW